MYFFFSTRNDSIFMFVLFYFCSFDGGNQTGNSVGNGGSPTSGHTGSGSSGGNSSGPTKSTKGASKMRRDMINSEIAHLRDLLPLPSSTRQRLSQLQLMALVCVYVRKSNYFEQGKVYSNFYISTVLRINL